jgi:hypothetical protein
MSTRKPNPAGAAGGVPAPPQPKRHKPAAAQTPEEKEATIKKFIIAQEIERRKRHFIHLAEQQFIRLAEQQPTEYEPDSNESKLIKNCFITSNILNYMQTIVPNPTVPLVNKELVPEIEAMYEQINALIDKSLLLFDISVPPTERSKTANYITALSEDLQQNITQAVHNYRSALTIFLTVRRVNK